MKGSLCFVLCDRHQRANHTSLPSHMQCLQEQNLMHVSLKYLEMCPILSTNSENFKDTCQVLITPLVGPKSTFCTQISTHVQNIKLVQRECCKRFLCPHFCVHPCTPAVCPRYSRLQNKRYLQHFIWIMCSLCRLINEFVGSWQKPHGNMHPWSCILILCIIKLLILKLSILSCLDSLVFKTISVTQDR